MPCQCRGGLWASRAPASQTPLDGGAAAMRTGPPPPSRPPSTPGSAPSECRRVEVERGGRAGQQHVHRAPLAQCAPALAGSVALSSTTATSSDRGGSRRSSNDANSPTDRRPARRHRRPSSSAMLGEMWDGMVRMNKRQALLQGINLGARRGGRAGCGARQAATAFLPSPPLPLRLLPARHRRALRCPGARQAHRHPPPPPQPPHTPPSATPPLAGLIVTSALMIWKTLILVTGSESPVRASSGGVFGRVEGVCGRGRGAAGWERTGGGHRPASLPSRAPPR